MKTSALLFTGPDRVERGEIELPPLSSCDVRVDNVLTCVSPGTELRCLSGLQEGRDQWPFVPGYAAIGRVTDAGDDAGLSEGQWVVHTGTRRADGSVLWGGHAATAVCRPGGVFPIEPSRPLDQIVAWRLAAIAYHGLRLARPAPHETVVVIGLGAIGHCAARLYAMSGTRTIAVDASDGRVAAARAAGIEAIAVTGSLRDTLASQLPAEGADIIVDATGAADVTAEAIGLARELDWGDAPGASPRLRYVFQGSYVGNITLPYLPFFRREPTLLIPRSDQPSDSRAVLDLIARGALSLKGVVGEIARPEDAPELYARLRSRTGSLVTAAFRWRNDDGNNLE